MNGTPRLKPGGATVCRKAHNRTYSFENMLPASPRLPIFGHLPCCKLPKLAGSFLVLRAFEHAALL